MPNIKKNTKLITNTLNMLGMATNKVYTAILSPSFLDIILKGLSTLMSLSTLKIFSLPLLEANESIEKITIEKSSIFHEDLR